MKKQTNTCHRDNKNRSKQTKILTLKMTNVKKHNSNHYSNMKNIEAATILVKKEGRKERKKQSKNEQQT
jgi:hypothetical protein